MRALTLLCLLALALAANGCGSVQVHRARQHPATIDALAPQERDRVLSGAVRRGDPREAVYVALGSPAYARRIDADTSEWIYFGTRAEAGDVDAADPDALRFLSRSELRIPRPGEQRARLTVVFLEGRVEAWTFGPIEREDLHAHEPVRYGRMPQE